MMLLAFIGFSPTAEVNEQTNTNLVKAMNATAHQKHSALGLGGHHGVPHSSRLGSFT